MRESAVADRDRDVAALLAVNERFYEVFAAGDLAAMMRLWAESLPVACIHPGAPVIVGREAVLASWRQVLGSPPPVKSVDATAHPLPDGGGFVTCYERIADGALAATNVFAREGGEWRMVHHQAGPTSARPRREPPPQTVH